MRTIKFRRDILILRKEKMNVFQLRNHKNKKKDLIERRLKNLTPLSSMQLMNSLITLSCVKVLLINKHQKNNNFKLLQIV